MFMEVSARQGTNVKALFRKVAEALPAPDDANANGCGITTDGARGAGGQSRAMGKQRDPFLLTPSLMKDGEQNAAANSSRGRCC
ncbi:small GTP-binding protein RAB6 [Trypanosoma grayi]|uniref:small GTP-binding protein RAB6 n=1 Tax=Trypanosoma grayi TaxID=71804 RepID=UPI0004F47A3C|nr:small GTP-binding protein RAB6 [Trypanosoma grayi]KEG06650.1 small GTP-binding protein RAB6 [Trypanosoma grayi]